MQEFAVLGTSILNLCHSSMPLGHSNVPLSLKDENMRPLRLNIAPGTQMFLHGRPGIRTMLIQH